jgi:uncharacterized protein YdiU (UPF0061 family)
MINWNASSGDRVVNGLFRITRSLHLLLPIFGNVTMSIWPSLNIHQRFLSLPDTFYSRVRPSPILSPNWLAWNSELAEEFSSAWQPDKELLSIFSGQQVPENITPIAMKYAGH